jgi:glutamyl-tRNA reductase
LTNVRACGIIIPEREKEITKMNANEIKERIEKLERWCWFEQMADFMNWTEYHKAQAEIKELKKKLEEIEKGA